MKLIVTTRICSNQL